MSTKPYEYTAESVRESHLEAAEVVVALTASRLQPQQGSMVRTHLLPKVGLQEDGQQHPLACMLEKQCARLCRVQEWLCRSSAHNLNSSQSQA